MAIPTQKKIAPNIYLVRNYAGFKRALKNWGAGDLPVSNNPSEYPAIVTFSKESDGNNFIRVVSCSETAMKTALSGQAQLI